ncbi:MAG: hypothetical protein HY013_13640 [Candidatus Solibacter usitatus]|nr:hypothetical protein [Candidatus Solibacter usitatus]
MKRVRRKRKGAGRVDLDDILPEYDFSRSRPNKYASRYESIVEKAKRRPTASRRA